MNKKLLFVMSLILIACFSAGIFTELQTSPDDAILSTKLPSLGSSIFSYIKSDLTMLVISLFLSATVFLMPAVAGIVMYKTFSLGFTAAYILSAYEIKGVLFIAAALLPQALIKLPAYIALIFVSYQTAVFVKSNYRKKPTIKAVVPYVLKFFYCFIAMAVSSIIQAVLLQGVL